MLKKFILAFAGLSGAWLGYTLHHIAGWKFPELNGVLNINDSVWGSLVFAALGAILFLLIGSLCAQWVSSRLHSFIASFSNTPMSELAAGATGLIGGLLLAILIYPSLTWLGKVGQITGVAVTMACGYMGLRIGLEKKEELASLWTSGKWGQLDYRKSGRLRSIKSLILASSSMEELRTYVRLVLSKARL
ncbi:hypothetical protein JCM16418_4397 [Paenibacillus pini JCM 16418]|uniref:Uncharacterized protein n=1 Tax=Paenibacillus pini JCM 16418 TaxID=1236976 RepID=W7YH37_9BACL|nr:hypothetical protein JCM16418_4397 [Paenibacillus pini JCM 16418]